MFDDVPSGLFGAALEGGPAMPDKLGVAAHGSGQQKHGGGHARRLDMPTQQVVSLESKLINSSADDGIKQLECEVEALQQAMSAMTAENQEYVKQLDARGVEVTALKHELSKMQASDLVLVRQLVEQDEMVCALQSEVHELSTERAAAASLKREFHEVGKSMEASRCIATEAIRHLPLSDSKESLNIAVNALVRGLGQLRKFLPDG